MSTKRTLDELNDVVDAIRARIGYLETTVDALIKRVESIEQKLKSTPD